MFEEREVLTLLIALGVFAFSVRHRAILQELPNSFCLILSYGFLVFSFICSLAEEIAWTSQINFLQHLSGALSALVLLRWSWKTIGPGRSDDSDSSAPTGTDARVSK